MNKSNIFITCYLIGIFFLTISMILMFLIVFFEKYFDENKYIYILLTAGIGLILISPKDMFNDETTPNAHFTYKNFRGYFTCFLGMVSIIMFIYLKLYILK